MSVLESLSSYFFKEPQPIESYIVVIPKDHTQGALDHNREKLSYFKGDYKFRFLLEEGVIYLTSYKLLDHFVSHFLDNNWMKAALCIVPMGSFGGYLYLRRSDLKDQEMINQVIRRHNAANYYQDILPLKNNDDRSFDLICFDEKENLRALMESSVNNGSLVHLDYYPHGQLAEKLPHFKHPVHQIEVNHFNSKAGDLGWLSFPPHLYPDLTKLKLSNCGVPHLMDYSALTSLVELELNNVILDNNYKYYWRKFPVLKHLILVYDNLNFTEGITLAKDQNLITLTIGFTHKFTNLTFEEHYRKNSTLLQELPDKIGELTLQNLVLNDTYDFNNREIDSLILSQSKLSPGWNIRGKFHKIILEKSQVLSLPRLEATPKIVGGYCLDLDEIQIIDSYWYDYKFFWTANNPSYDLITAQKYLDHGLLRITFPDLVQINDLTDSISSDDLEFDAEHDSYGILQIVGEDLFGKGLYRLYQVDLPKGNPVKLAELEDKVARNNDILINDRRADLEVLVTNHFKQLKRSIEEATLDNPDQICKV